MAANDLKKEGFFFGRTAVLVAAVVVEVVTLVVLEREDTSALVEVARTLLGLGAVAATKIRVVLVAGVTRTSDAAVASLSSLSTSPVTVAVAVAAAVATWAGRD